MTLANLKLTAKISGTISTTLGDGSTPALDYTKGLFTDIPSDANLLFVQGYSIASEANQSLDLAGALLDSFGAACVFSKVYAILIQNLTVTTGKTIQVGGDANHVPIFGAGADYLTIGPKGVLLVANTVDGWTVTAGTGDILKIANPGGGTNVSVAVAVLGKS